MALLAPSPTLRDEPVGARRDRTGGVVAGGAVQRTATVDGECTLDDVIVGAWEALAVHRVVRCIVCGGEMAVRYAAAVEQAADTRHAADSLHVADRRLAVARCRDCGTEMR